MLYKIYKKFCIFLIKKRGAFRRLYLFILFIYNSIIQDKYPKKIFVIGLNKTGTTSVKKALVDFGYVVADQFDAEILSEDVLSGNYRGLKKYLKTAEVFQDLPFATRGLFRYLYKLYPDSKFILTIRDENKWFNSLNQFMEKRLNNEGFIVQDVIKVKDTLNLKYRYPSFDYILGKKIWHAGKSYVDNDEPLFDYELCNFYFISHINEVKSFFKDKNNLLVLNIEDDEAYGKLCNFLGKEKQYSMLPHENKT